MSSLDLRGAQRDIVRNRPSFAVADHVRTRRSEGLAWIPGREQGQGRGWQNCAFGANPRTLAGQHRPYEGAAYAWIDGL